MFTLKLPKTIKDHHGSMPDVSRKLEKRLPNRSVRDSINTNILEYCDSLQQRNLLLQALNLEPHCNSDNKINVTKFSKSNPSMRHLYVIAQEVHSKSKYNSCFENTCNCRHYHSWPKHKIRKRNMTDKRNYHNFGLLESGDTKTCVDRNVQYLSEQKRSVEVNQLPETFGRLSFKKRHSKKDGKSPKKSLRSDNHSDRFQLHEHGNQASTCNNSGSSMSNEDLTTDDDEIDDCDSGVGQFADISPYNNFRSGINPPLFKTRTDLMLQWFSGFSDEQKNIFIQRIMGASGLPQMHMLSLKMAPIMHKGCPENCQDMLQWLPEDVVYQILEYLDPISLSRASRVNRVWYNYSLHSHLWQRLCLNSEYRISPATHPEQIDKFRTCNGKIKWRELFVERYVCKQNWKRGRCKIKTLVGHTQGVSCVQFDNKRIVSGSSDKTIRVWNLHSESTKPILTLIGHSGTVRCLQLSGNRVISGSADNTIKVWDLSVGSDWNVAACKVTMTGHLHTVRCLQVDNEKVISGSYDMTLKVWDLFTGTCKLTLRGHTAEVLCVQFDEEKILSGSADNTIKVWSLETGACLTTLQGHLNSVTCLQFNRDRIISGSLDCTLKFWNLSDGSCIGTIDWIRSEGHTRVVRCLQADNWKIVSAGDDKTLKVWSLKTGERFVTLYKHTDGVTCLQFNDHMIVSGSYDKTVKVWDFNP